MYITAEDLSEAIGFQRAAMKAGIVAGEGETQDEVWDAKLAAVISQVSDLIDGMVSVRYAPADVSESAVLKRICTMISVYDVWCGFARNELPKSVMENKADAMSMLKQIQQGSLSLVLDSPPEDAPPPVESEFEAQTQVFSRIMM